MASKTISTILNLQDKMSPKLVKVSSKVKQLDKDAQRATQKMANMVNKWNAGVDKMVGKAGRLAKVGAGMAAAAGVAGAAQLVKQSDTYAGIQARLKLINDGQQTVAEFNEKIFKSADKARGNYQDMAEIVGKLGVTAGSAFKDNDEILKFTEILSKNFKISGASAQEQSAAMYQLTQAMGAGKLQGDEFRSIMENAPLLAQAIAKEMNVSMGALKEMSSEGKITSDVIKAALFNSADEIDEKFKEMPVTFSESAMKIKNHLINKLQPTMQKLSNWLNSAKGEAVINRIIAGIDKLVGHLPAVWNGLKTIYGYVVEIYDFFKKYQDVIVFLGTFVVSLVAVTKAVTILKSAFTALQIITLLLNGTLALSPFGLIAIGVSAAVAGIVLLIKNFDKVKAYLKWFFGFGAKPDDSGSGTKTGKPKTTRRKTGRNATGTSYWQGGLTSINEHGKEIVDLPNGTRIIPADKSKKISNSKNITIQNLIINAKGVTAAEVINEFVPKLKLELANM